MAAHIVLTEQARSKLAGMVELFNSGDIDGFVAQHSEDVTFSTPIWRARYGDQSWGRGIAAHRSDVLEFRETFGHLRISDVFPVGSSVSVLTVDESGNRTEFCLDFDQEGLVKAVFAFHVGLPNAPVRRA